MGANPGLAFALDGEEGYGFVSSSTGLFLQKRKSLGGLHGYAPDRTEMDTGFVIAGCSIRRSVLPRVNLVDIAPTLAQLRGWRLGKVDGEVLPVRLDE